MSSAVPPNGPVESRTSGDRVDIDDKLAHYSLVDSLVDKGVRVSGNYLDAEPKGPKEARTDSVGTD